MGYRSAVVALIYPDVQNKEDEQAAYDRLKTLMNTTFKQIMDEDFGEDAEWIDDRRVLKFKIDDVKWYESYPGVRRFHDMLNMLGGDSVVDETPIGGYCTEFMRVGEDDNDIESDTNGHNNHYYLSVSREIVCDV